jgi:hypothetical protein
MNMRIKNDKVMMCDVDETLVIYNWPKDREGETVEITNNGITKRLLPFFAHVELIKKFKFLGYDVVVWSMTGEAWANKIVEALELKDYVTLTMSKPMFYTDDQPCENWMGTRIYKDNK